MAWATSLAPMDSELSSMKGRLGVARGQVESGILELRRAVALDGANVRARYALVEALDRTPGEVLAEETLGQLELLGRTLPKNLAFDVERARFAARGGDGIGLIEAVRRLDGYGAEVTDAAGEQLDAVSPSGVLLEVIQVAAAR
jgi:hypothetical protein